ncbi:GNAT family N-acetyltransferase [Flavobacterium psychroterrae]|uniref:GNAT family N-acetyltransferase n=1 Tax=Flavobacterium psychroterrae TaxID=2133767 RepID=A0ABS5PFS5_9FLAO|nr:GNAT family N-acetyltransferase [Flavobacterium psychroterrae]
MCGAESSSNLSDGSLRNASKKNRFGKTLVKHCQTYYNANEVDLIWLNARTAAVGLYKKMDYQPLGEPFDIKDMGEHY